MIHIFILNPNTGVSGWTKQFRKHLSEIENLQYYVFSASSGENETALVRRVLHIFEGEKVRLYSCGGSGSMQRMLDGIDDFENVEVAMCPVGNNGFLRVFGDKSVFFYDIDRLINGEVIRIDYIKTNHGVAVNSFSTGHDSKFLYVKSRLNRIGIRNNRLAYFLGLLVSLFFTKSNDYEATFGEHKISGKSCEIVLANGTTLGDFLEFSDNNNISDGLAYYAFYPELSILKKIKTAIILQKKDHEKINALCEHGLTLSMTLYSKDGKNIPVSLDGEVKYKSNWKVEIVHKGLPFVVPKEVGKSE